VKRRTSLFAVLLAVSAATSPLCFAQSATDLNAQGRDAQVAGDNYKAIELYKTALEKNPDYVDPMIGLAETYFALGEFSESLKYAQQAESYDRANIAVLDLEGRARIGLGDFAAASKIFNTVLQSQPNNLDAKFGLAEIQIASGQPKTAAAAFESALSIAPENTRALLSLVMLYDSQQNYAKADTYARIALQYHPDDALTHYVAARHYLATGNLTAAQSQIETALDLNPGNVDETLLESEVYLRTQQYEKVVPIIQSILKTNANDNLLWYSLGLADEQLGKYDDGITAFARAFTLRPDDEVSRIAMESVIINQLDLKDPRRAKYAQYHFDQGSQYEQRDFIDRAVREYRRGLKIDPTSKTGRLLYANVLNKQGFESSYLDALELLKNNGRSDTDIDDQIEIEQNALSDSVASDWDISQFTIDREPYSLSIFYSPGGDMIHYLGQRYLAGYFSDTLESTQNIKLSAPPQAAAGFAQAFRTSRQNGSEYFVILSFNESERYFRVTADLYAAATGTKVDSDQSYRTGNNRVTDALAIVAGDVDGAFPARGKLLNRKFDQGVIDLGARDGAKAGDKLLIVKNGSLQLAKDRLGFEYPQDAVVGNFEITRTDDLISEGTVTKNQFFDLINPNDWVIYTPPKNTPTTPEAPPPGELYQGFLKIPASSPAGQ
jgi:tetratricopeptide (TPR) repeat protein